MAGLLTRTIAQSPVIRWILHARIRRKQYNDVVFVGDHFIQVKQVRNHGNLELVATKNDFDARIRAARTFSNVTESDDDDFLVKTEDEDRRDERTPPQCIVLTTDMNDLLFIHLADAGNGDYRFVQQSCPMPTFNRTLFQPGEHLAIDPYSRALAVAANEREVVIYSAKAKERIQHEMRTADQNWCPISAQRPLQVDGVIQHIDFLYPPLDDNGSHNEDQVILLLIIVNERRIRAEWIEWNLTSDLHHAIHHGGQPLDMSNSVPNLMIPLRNAAFLLINGTTVTKWNDILCGAATPVPMHTAADLDAAHPGASPRRPAWTNWCRPVRGSAAHNDTDYLYLIREDGQVYLFQIQQKELDTSHAGDFDCHVGSAFASLGSARDPDILAIAGDMSTGCIQSIGSWFSPLSLAERSRSATMDMELIETIPNWASVTDMVTSTLPGKAQRTRDAVFVTSGRQPYGAITELRRGLEARLSAYFELEGLRSVTGVWALPFASVGHILLLLSSPAGTRLLSVSADADMENIEEVDGTEIALDSEHTTLAAAITSDGKIIQITDRSICISPGTSANFEDCARIECRAGESIAAAAIDTSLSIALVARKSDSGGLACELTSYKLRSDEHYVSGDAQIQIIGSCALLSEPLALATAPRKDKAVVFVANADAQLEVFTVGHTGEIEEMASRTLLHSAEGPNLCDSIVVLQSDAQVKLSEPMYIVICGLRHGGIYTVVVDSNSKDYLGAEVMRDFSNSKVKLTQPSGDNCTAYAMSGTDTCLLTWDGKGISSLQIQSIWTSDKLRPELPQGAVAACNHMPPEHLLSSPDLAGSLVMISGDEFLVTTLERTPTTVPRQITVSGTPNRLIYAEEQRCLVSAAMKYDTKAFPSSMPHGKPEERRQIWPVIDFVSSRSSAPSYTYEMQPGERVYALLEWSYKQSEDKKYSFILVGGSYTRASGSVRGRITFLQPSNKSWEVVNVKEGRSLNFDAPVYALALLDDLTFIACTGRNIVASRFSEGERKWEQICAPVQIASPGVYITTTGPVAYISSNADSMVKATLIEQTTSGEQGSEGQYHYKLQVQTMGPRAESLLSHLVLPPASEVAATQARQETQNVTSALMMTKYGQVVALKHDSSKRINAGDLLFEAQLPRSLTRIRQCYIRPRWKADPPDGVIIDNLLGCAADGTLVGIALLSQDLLRRLSWLQRLCEWSGEISPHSWQMPAYSVTEGMYARDERAMPAGLIGGGRREDVVMRTSKPRLQDGHVDGDVLARLLEGGNEKAKDRLRRVMEEIAAREDRAGEWMRAHLEMDIETMEEVVEVLQRLLDMWM
jgi:hypothetical protein